MREETWETLEGRNRGESDVNSISIKNDDDVVDIAVVDDDNNNERIERRDDCCVSC